MSDTKKIISPYLQVESTVWDKVKKQARSPGHQRPPSAEAGIILKEYFEKKGADIEKN